MGGSFASHSDPFAEKWLSERRTKQNEYGGPNRQKDDLLKSGFPSMPTGGLDQKQHCGPLHRLATTAKKDVD